MMKVTRYLFAMSSNSLTLHCALTAFQKYKREDDQKVNTDDS